LFKRTKSTKHIAVSAVAALTMLSTTASARGGAQPPYENLATAKQYVQSVSSRVQSLIYRIQGGGHGDDGAWGEGQPGHGGHGPRFPIGRGHFADRSQLTDAEEFEDDVEATEEGEVLENDHLANLALQVMGQKLFDLGQTIDQATMSYGTPGFWGYWTQACAKSKALIVANQGAKVSASLPLQGLATPADFEPNDFELNAVRQQLWCP
jgi:hypothetical protein